MPCSYSVRLLMRWARRGAWNEDRQCSTLQRSQAPCFGSPILDPWNEFIITVQAATHIAGGLSKWPFHGKGAGAK